MATAVVRDEPPLPDEAVVLRGGWMVWEAFETAVWNSKDEYGVLALSVFSDPNRAPAEVRMQHLARYNRVRTATAGAIRRAGYELVPTDDFPHYDLVLPDADVGAHWARLDAVFGPALADP